MVLAVGVISAMAHPKRTFQRKTFSRRFDGFALAGVPCRALSSRAKSKSTRPGSTKQSSTSLNYRDVDDDMTAQKFYTDTLWHTALRPSSDQDLRHISVPHESTVIAPLNDANTPVELRPICVGSMLKTSAAETKNPTDELMEAVTAFNHVAIEIGFVAMAATNVNMF